ncbi:MAG: hypothetical protein SPI31_06510 [Eubacteriales bacterium]|nr:hypothetical protein [Eubacteriales bacterium]
MKKMELRKKLLIADDAILALMVAAFFVFNLNGHDTGNCSIVVSAWIAQVAIGTGAYDWKAKAENLVKRPLLLLVELPKDIRTCGKETSSYPQKQQRQETRTRRCRNVAFTVSRPQTPAS